MIIDFHSHVLRGVDHGCVNTEQSVAQFNLMSRFGTEKIVATSHFSPEINSVEGFRSRVDSAVRAITNTELALPEIDLCLGAEVLVCDGLENLEGLDRLCIRGTNTLLLELPFGINLNRSIVGVVEQIIDRGYTVVLAHIDRYLESNERGINSLLAAGAVAQVNAMSMFSFGIRRRVMPYIESDHVCALGSDLHKVDTSLYKKFSLLKKKIGSDNFEAIMKRTEKLLEGADVIHLGNKKK